MEADDAANTSPDNAGSVAPCPASDLSHALVRIESEMRVARLERQVDELADKLKEYQSSTSGSRIPLVVVAVLLGALGTLVATGLTTQSKDRQLDLARVTNELELKREKQKHQHRVKEQYLTYVMVEHGGDVDRLARLLEFLGAVENDYGLSGWAEQQKVSVQKRSQEALHQTERLLEQSKEQLRVAEARSRLEEDRLQSAIQSNGVLEAQQGLARVQRRRAELAAADALQKLQAQQEPACKRGTARDESDRTVGVCSAPSASAYRDGSKWRWVAISVEGRSVSCLCQAEA